MPILSIASTRPAIKVISGSELTLTFVRTRSVRLSAVVHWQTSDPVFCHTVNALKSISTQACHRCTSVIFSEKRQINPGAMIYVSSLPFQCFVPPRTAGVEKWPKH